MNQPLNFSAGGVRWKLTVISSPTAVGTAGSSPVQVPGLYFESADGDRRFLPLEALPTAGTEAIRQLSNQELGALAARAREWRPETGSNLG